MRRWKIWDTGRNSAEENMRLDKELLHRAEEQSGPVLHLYEWEGDSATYGHFTDPSQLLDLGEAANLGLNLAKRPTGGGIIFHLWDLAFSVLVPAHCPEFSTNTLDNYAFVNNAVIAAVEEFLNQHGALSLIPEEGRALDAHSMHFCMAKPTKYDVMWQGKKVAGAAQRRTKKGFLHQGSISLLMPPWEYLEKVLRKGTQVRDAMQLYTCPILKQSIAGTELIEAKQHLSQLLAMHLSKGI